MTEEEAKTKWCPMVRYNYFGDGRTDCNRPDCNRPDGGPNCIASDCMMWVWDKGPGEITLIDDDGNEKQAALGTVRLNTGHCGLCLKR